MAAYRKLRSLAKLGTLSSSDRRWTEMLRLKSCPRCKGDVLLEKDKYGWYEQCLQCSYLRDMETILVVKQQQADKAKQVNLAHAA